MGISKKIQMVSEQGALNLWQARQQEGVIHNGSSKTSLIALPLWKNKKIKKKKLISRLGEFGSGQEQ